MMENDPSIDATMGVYTSALNDYVRGDLEYESDLPYEILTDRVHPWDYEDFKNAYVDVSETLRETMSRNPFMKVFVANGYFDLATPHFATEYTFAHLGLDAGAAGQRPMAYYDAGHMMYVVEDAPWPNCARHRRLRPGGIHCRSDRVTSAQRYDAPHARVAQGIEQLPPKQ